MSGRSALASVAAAAFPAERLRAGRAGKVEAMMGINGQRRS